MPRLEQLRERAPRADEVALPDELLERPRTHPGGERRVRHGLSPRGGYRSPSGSLHDPPRPLVLVPEDAVRTDAEDPRTWPGGRCPRGRRSATERVDVALGALADLASTTVPSTEIHSYAVATVHSDTDTRGSRATLRSFRRPSAVLTSTCASSASIQTMVACGEPSAFRVTSVAKFGAREQLQVAPRQLRAHVVLLAAAGRRSRARRAARRRPRRGAGQRVRARLRLRERGHVAERVLAGQQHHEPVQAHRDPAVRRHAVAERLQQVPELLLDLVRARARAPRTRAAAPRDRGCGSLPPPISNPFRTRSYARAFAVSGSRSSVQRRRERVVVRHPLPLVVAPLEQRRLGVPAELPRALAGSGRAARRSRRRPSSADVHAVGRSATMQIRSPSAAPVAPRPRPSRPATGTSRPATATPSP